MDDKEEERGSQADRARPETSSAEAEAQPEHQSLRETERLMELEVPPGRGRHGTEEAKACQSWPRLVLRAGENPLIMQMALGVAIEGHLFCIPWAAASETSPPPAAPADSARTPARPVPAPRSQPSKPRPASLLPEEGSR